MATVTLQPDPFVKWKFTCNNAQQKKDAQEKARNFLKGYLKGFANALRQENQLYPDFSFQIANEQFLPAPNSNNEFIYSATLKRKSDPGSPFPQPDSTINPIKPIKPTP